MQLYLEYQERRSGGKVCAGQEDESWPSHEDEIIDFSPVRLRLTRPEKFNIEEINTELELVKGDRVYLIIPRYFDGGTFGRTCGYWNIWKVVKTIEEADKIQAYLENLTEKEYTLINTKKKYNDKDRIYCPWFGYFSGLEQVQVRLMDIE